MRDARRCPCTRLAIPRLVAALAAFRVVPAASAQLIPGAQTFPCHVLHVTNQTRNPALVTVSINSAALSRVGSGMVEACTAGVHPARAEPAVRRLRSSCTARASRIPTSRQRSPGRVPQAHIHARPRAHVADVKRHFHAATNAAEPGNWLPSAHAFEVEEASRVEAHPRPARRSPSRMSRGRRAVHSDPSSSQFTFRQHDQVPRSLVVAARNAARRSSSTRRWIGAGQSTSHPTFGLPRAPATRRGRHIGARRVVASRRSGRRSVLAPGRSAAVSPMSHVTAPYAMKQLVGAAAAAPAPGQPTARSVPLRCPRTRRPREAFRSRTRRRRATRPGNEARDLGAWK